MKKLALLPIFALTLAVIAGAYFLNTPSQVDATTLNNFEPASGEEAVNEGVDVEFVLKERILGDANAPIRISEHSSFTCGHCGNFHRNSFKQVKEQLIDTGKAYLVFSDFPLNAPALHASIISRCLPEDQYFDFVDMLFAEQENWAFEANYIKFLQNKANDYGLPTETIKECLGNKDIQDGILARVHATKTQWNISSTPSFVVNNKTVITGALPPEVFVEKVNEAIAAEAE